MTLSPDEAGHLLAACPSRQEMFASKKFCFHPFGRRLDGDVIHEACSDFSPELLLYNSLQAIAIETVSDLPVPSLNDTPPL
jgi:hypothetical protein